MKMVRKLLGTFKLRRDDKTYIKHDVGRHAIKLDHFLILQSAELLDG